MEKDMDMAYAVGNELSKLPGLGHTIEISRDGADFTVTMQVTDAERLAAAVPDFREAIERQRKGAVIESVIEGAPDDWEDDCHQIVGYLNRGEFDEAYRLACEIRDAESTSYGSDTHDFAPDPERIDEGFAEIMESRQMTAVISKNGGSMSLGLIGSYPDGGYELDMNAEPRARKKAEILTITRDAETLPSLIMMMRDGEDPASAAKRMIADIRADDARPKACGMKP